MDATSDKNLPKPPHVENRSSDRQSTSWKEIITSPYMGFGLGVAGLVAGAVFFWLSLSRVEPVYQVSPTEVVARKESPRLTVAWDGKPIDNLCLCRVGLWNHGKTPITQDRLPTSDPLRIVASPPVRLLSAEPSNVSRGTLRFGTRIEGPNVYLSIGGNDALERNDGAVIRLLFTGTCDQTSFAVVGRVIGSQGFKYREGQKDLPSGIKLLLALLLTILMYGALNIMDKVLTLVKGGILVRILTFSIGLCLAFLIMIAVIAGALSFYGLAAPSWANM